MPAQTLEEFVAVGSVKDPGSSLAVPKRLTVALIEWYQLYASEPEYGGSEHPFTIQTNDDARPGDAVSIVGFDDEESARAAFENAISTFESQGWSVTRTP